MKPPPGALAEGADDSPSLGRMTTNLHSNGLPKCLSPWRCCSYAHRFLLDGRAWDAESCPHVRVLPPTHSQDISQGRSGDPHIAALVDPMIGAVSLGMKPHSGGAPSRPNPTANLTGAEKESA